MTKEKIKIILLNKGMKISGLASQIGYSIQHVSNVINGHENSERVKMLIAETLGMGFRELWGDPDPDDVD